MLQFHSGMTRPAGDVRINPNQVLAKELKAPKLASLAQLKTATTKKVANKLGAKCSVLSANRLIPTSLYIDESIETP